MIEKVRKYIERFNMISNGDRIIVGVSGGADSVCLLTVLNELKKQYKLEILAVHINHMIRGEAADADEEYVKLICKKYDILCVTYRKDIVSMAEEQKLTVEEAGRKYRYECFEGELKKRNYDKIAVAHNKNDLCETVIFNMVRGSSINGLAGIRPVRGNIIRPLLNTERVEIEEYLKKKNIAFCIDATNESLDYTRNKIRHVIIPEMEGINERAIDHICKLSMEASVLYDAIKKQASMIEMTREGKTEVRIFIDSMKKSVDTARREAILAAIESLCGKRKDITIKHLEAVDLLCRQTSGKAIDLPYGLRARKSYEYLIIEKVSDTDKFSIEIDKNGKYEVGDASLLVEIGRNAGDVDISKKEYTKTLDYGKIKGRVYLRTPDVDDYIVVNSQGGRKKLNRLFTDCKVDRKMREAWPVVACGNEIIWAIGLRFSEAYKIMDDTKEIMILKYNKGDN